MFWIKVFARLLARLAPIAADPLAQVRHWAFEYLFSQFFPDGLCFDLLFCSFNLPFPVFSSLPGWSVAVRILFLLFRSIVCFQHVHRLWLAAQPAPLPPSARRAINQALIFWTPQASNVHEIVAQASLATLIQGNAWVSSSWQILLCVVVTKIVVFVPIYFSCCLDLISRSSLCFLFLCWLLWCRYCLFSPPSACIDHCLYCSSAVTCSQCGDDFVLNQVFGQDSCPTGTYRRGSTCTGQFTSLMFVLSSSAPSLISEWSSFDSLMTILHCIASSCCNCWLSLSFFFVQWVALCLPVCVCQSIADDWLFAALLFLLVLLRVLIPFILCHLCWIAFSSRSPSFDSWLFVFSMFVLSSWLHGLLLFLDLHDVRCIELVFFEHRKPAMYTKLWLGFLWWHWHGEMWWWVPCCFELQSVVWLICARFHVCSATGCPDHCASCQTVSECSQCADGFVLNQGVCNTSCPSGTHRTGSTCIGMFENHSCLASMLNAFPSFLFIPKWSCMHCSLFFIVWLVEFSCLPHVLVVLLFRHGSLFLCLFDCLSSACAASLPGCTACSSATVCASCDGSSSYFLNTTSQRCMQNCSLSFFGDRASGQCVGELLLSLPFEGFFASACLFVLLFFSRVPPRIPIDVFILS